MVETVPSIDALCRAPRSKYLALMQMQVQQGIAYPLGTLIDILASLLSTATVYYLWQAVFEAQPQVERFDWRAMQVYILVANAIFALLTTTSMRTMMQSIRTGAIASDLLRPYSYLAAQFAQALGRLITQGLVGGAAVALVGFALVGMAAPPTLAYVVMFLISVGLSFLISFLLNFLLGLLCFWTTDGEGLVWAYGITSFVFSGSLVPLQLLPGWLRTLALLLPFQGMIHTPLLIYLGVARGHDLLEALLLQVVWVIVLGVVLRLLWWRALRAAELPGG